MESYGRPSGEECDGSVTNERQAMATARKTAQAQPEQQVIPPVLELTSDFGHRVELTKDQIGGLMSPINPGRVASRTVQNRSLSYVEAWDIKATLIRVFGFGGFSSEVVESKIIDIREDGRQGTKSDGSVKTPYVMAYARVQLTIFGIGPGGKDAVYTEAAIGTNDGWTIGDVADNALKSAASDALKRCAINLGTQFGLSLYDNGTRGDVVKVLLNPEQAAMLKAYRDEHGPEPVVNAAAVEQFAGTLGATPVGAEEGRSLQDVTDEETSGPLYPSEVGS